MRRLSIGPIPAPVATRRRELKIGASVRKFCAGGWRIQRWGGGEARRSVVQSPAFEMSNLAVALLTGMVANACHSVSGAVDTRIVLVGGICV